MQNDQDDVSLSNLMGGGVVEQFDYELKRVLENIKDPNTGLAAREITLKLKIKPDQDRDFGIVGIAVTSKLAAQNPLQTKMFIADTPKGPVATEYNPQQPALPEIGSVTQLRGVK